MANLESILSDLNAVNELAERIRTAINPGFPAEEEYKVEVTQCDAKKDWHFEIESVEAKRFILWESAKTPMELHSIMKAFLIGVELSKEISES